MFQKAAMQRFYIFQYIKAQN